MKYFPYTELRDKQTGYTRYKAPDGTLFPYITGDNGQDRDRAFNECQDYVRAWINRIQSKIGRELTHNEIANARIVPVEDRTRQQQEADNKADETAVEAANPKPKRNYYREILESEPKFGKERLQELADEWERRQNSTPEPEPEPMSARQKRAIATAEADLKALSERDHTVTERRAAQHRLALAQANQIDTFKAAHAEEVKRRRESVEAKRDQHRQTLAELQRTLDAELVAFEELQTPAPAPVLKPVEMISKEEFDRDRAKFLASEARDKELQAKRLQPNRT